MEPVEAVAETTELRRLRVGEAPALDRSAYEAASTGKIATGTGGGQAWGVAVVPVPIDRYWRALNDDRSKAAWSDLADVELLQGQYCGSPRTVFQYLDVSVLSDRWWVIEQRANDALAGASAGKLRELIWKSVTHPDTLLNEAARAWAAKGEPIVETHGSWLLTDLGADRTLVEYTAYSDPGGMVPLSVVSRFAAGNVPTAIESMRKLAEAGPSCP
jgi:hypothetical protein